MIGEYKVIGFHPAELLNLNLNNSAHKDFSSSELVETYDMLFATNSIDTLLMVKQIERLLNNDYSILGGAFQNLLSE